MDDCNRSDERVLADECEYQQYVVLIQVIGYASRIDKADSTKGHVLQGVRADILGYRQQ